MTYVSIDRCRGRRCRNKQTWTVRDEKTEKKENDNGGNDDVDDDDDEEKREKHSHTIIPIKRYHRMTIIHIYRRSRFTCFARLRLTFHLIASPPSSLALPLMFSRSLRSLSLSTFPCDYLEWQQMTTSIAKIKSDDVDGRRSLRSTGIDRKLYRQRSVITVVARRLFIFACDAANVCASIYIEFN